MARTLLFWWLTAATLPAIVLATQESGSVRAADQFIPGATVTAVCGTDKITTITDDAGRFELNASPYASVQKNRFAVIPGS